MASDNNVETDEKEAPSTTHEQSEAPEPGPSTIASEGNNSIQQQTAKNTEGVRTKPAFPWKLTDEEKGYAYTLQEKDKAIKNAAVVVKAYSDEMIKRWNEEIDNLLVYAGLFSAILTAFNVQSYILLQPSTPDPTLLMLQQISQQLNSFSVTPTGTLVNSTHPVSFAPVQAPPVERWAIWLNSLWFSGLIFSLASASTGIMVKQWIHEYQAGISGDSPEIARLRQYRLNHLEKWHVAEIVAFLPVLLQIALFLFFSGLLILLWHYHSTVATIASVLVGIVALFVVGTTIMPLIWRSCCYLSPPVYLIFNIVQNVKYGLGWFRATICRGLIRYHYRFAAFLHLPLQGLRSWADKHACTPVTFNTWRGREKSTVQSVSSTLDVDLTIHAYSTTIDVKRLSDAGVIFESHGRDAFHKLYTKIQKLNEQHFGEKDFDDSSAELWAGHLFYLLRGEKRLYTIYTQTGSYPDSIDLSSYNQILALLADVSRGDEFSLRCLKLLFTFHPPSLRLMPWNVVRRVAAVMETELCRQDRPWDDPHRKWNRVFLALEILVQCCFAQVNLWQRSPKDVHACMRYILGLDVLQKEWLRENVSKKQDLNSQIITAFTLILNYLGDFADAWGYCSAVEDFMEAVRTVIEMVEGGGDIDCVKEELLLLKNNFWISESLFKRDLVNRSRYHYNPVPVTSI